ncbi:InlB B-repeat-containing protein [Fodinibius sp. Rm-B-1B1-1]|uniref:InlB B-repeat-containing protein n=1 Tax=Fodinibius alkaliphilus TaxID=3140241 RepID=UPI003159C527
MRYLLQTFIILFTLAVISCSSNGTGPDSEAGNNEETSTYNLDVTVTPSEGGSISPSASDSYEDGEQIELQADANDEYLFIGWTGDIESSDNPLSLTIDQDYSITANFELKNYKLVVNTEGEGTVNEKIVEQQSKEYEHGTVVELTASPAKGYKFVEWTGDVTGSENPVQITVENPQEVTALFEKKSFGINVITDGSGAVVLNPDQQEYLYNSTVEIEANPAHGWSLMEWQGDISGTDTLITITVDTAKMITAVFDSPFAGGTGTEADPFQISTIEQLQAIDNPEYNSDYFVQIDDIDGSETASWNLGKGFKPLYLSGGVYDGQGYIISDLTIDRDDNVGMFVSIGDGVEVRNIKLENVDITGSGRGTGGLAGMVNQNGKVSNSSVTGKVHCTDGRCGGLVGDNYGSIENSFADVTVTSIEDYVGGLVGLNWGSIEYSYAIGNVSGIYNVGGLVGKMTNNNDSYIGHVKKSYAKGTVTGKDRVGGLVGSNSSDTRITYSYASGEVIPSTAGNTSLGGLIGVYYDTNSVVQNCYWDTESTGQAEGAGGNTSLSSYNYGLTTSEMTGSNAKTNMSEFDFVSIWQSVDSDYPTLFWE